MTATESRQFGILHRDFLARMADLEVISAGGDVRALLIRIGSLLGSAGILIAYLMVPRYFFSRLPHATLVRLAWNDEEFLISLTIAVTGLCVVMTWNNVFPDRRDALVLGVLPIRGKIQIAARFAAIATAVTAAILITNLVTGLTFPFVLATGIGESIRSFISWWITLFAAGTFTFSCGLALQGVMGQLLPWRHFLRISGALQISWLFVVFGFFFLTPPFGDSNPPAWIPSFWFVGLLHVLRHDSNELMNSLALKAVIAMGVVIPVAAVVSILSSARNARRIIETPEIAPAKNPRLANALIGWYAPAPFDRAVVQFTARTIARSRQHRLMIAFYGGLALALAVTYSSGFIQADRSLMSAMRKPNMPLLIMGMIIMTFALLGIRAIFALPIALRANWSFRVTAMHRPGAYFEAVRKAFYGIAAIPVWTVLAIAYFALWPERFAAEHMILLILAGIVLTERTLYQFRKIPFTCSWMPGGNLRGLRRFIYCVFFILFAAWVALIEIWTIETTARLIVAIALLAAASFLARRRTREFANDPSNSLQFEDSGPVEIFALDLRQDGACFTDDAYVEAIDPHFGRSLPRRLMPYVAGLALLMTAGFFYEQISEWRDGRNYPPLGRSVDIGGRTLNLYCSGQGGNTVIFDSGSALPGYDWFRVQPEVAKFARACWYDRAGYGWSDPATGPRTSEEIARDLHQLLRAANVAPPYILVGHSFGGLNVRVFSARHPSEIAGIVLVDSTDENRERGPGLDLDGVDGESSLEALLPHGVLVFGERLTEISARFGMMRFFNDGPNPELSRYNPQAAEMINALQLQAKSFSLASREGLDEGESLRQVQGIHSFGNTPLEVLTAGRIPRPPDPDEAQAFLAYWHYRIYTAQANLSKLSSRGSQVILDTSHNIPTSDPNAVVSAIRRIEDKANAR